MAKYVVDGDELDLPAKQLKHVLFLSDKLLIAEWNPGEAEKLVNAWVGFFEILGADEDTRKCDQFNHVVLGVILEK